MLNAMHQMHISNQHDKHCLRALNCAQSEILSYFEGNELLETHYLRIVPGESHVDCSFSEIAQCSRTSYLYECCVLSEQQPDRLGPSSILFPEPYLYCDQKGSSKSPVHLSVDRDVH